MKFDIKRQESYSRGQLLLRSFFAWFYIMLPYSFAFTFFSAGAIAINFLAWWSILFTGKYPQSYFNVQKLLLGWHYKVVAVMNNLVDGMPGMSNNVVLNFERQEKYSRGLLFLRTFFGVYYIMLPHGVCLFFRSIASSVLQILAWWAVLFTGSYPEKWHAFNVGTFRWQIRFYLYLYYLSDEYPPFSGL